VGSGSDIVPRIVFDQLAPQLGQPITVENRVGAGGTIGVNAVARPILTLHAVVAFQRPHRGAGDLASLPYDAAEDFAGVVSFGRLPIVLVISPSKGSRPSSNSS